MKEWLERHGWDRLTFDARNNPRPVYEYDGLLRFDPGDGSIAIEAAGHGQSLTLHYRADPFVGAESLADILRFVADNYCITQPSRIERDSRLRRTLPGLK